MGIGLSLESAQSGATVGRLTGRFTQASRWLATRRSETSLFGDLLRKHRIAANLTQEALAERAGLSARGISDLERGARTHPYRETLSMLVSALGLSGAERAAFIQAAKRPGKPSAPGRRGRRAATACRRRCLASSAGIGNWLRSARLLRDDAVRLVTLTGTGGVGKTRLALAAAEDVRGSFADGAVFVDLAPVARPEPGSGSHRGDARSGRAEVGVDRWNAVRRFLEARRMLLLLDNFEHVLAAAPMVSELLQACPGVKALVTSREPLRLQGEREFAVRTFPLPDPSGGNLGGRAGGECRGAAVRGAGDRGVVRFRARAGAGRPRWLPFAAASMGCRWPSSWPRRG